MAAKGPAGERDEAGQRREHEHLCVWAGDEAGVDQPGPPGEAVLLLRRLPGRLQGSSRFEGGPDVCEFSGDIRDPYGVRNAVSGTEMIFHLAALIGTFAFLLWLTFDALELGPRLVGLASAIPHPSSVVVSAENSIGVVLAAGGSTRFGSPKQLLDYHGRPFVRAAAEQALRAGLRPVLVVTGAEAERVSAALKGLPVSLIHNPDWQAGQSTSIKAGITALPGAVGGAIFLLADQPQVSVEILRALVERHSQDLPSVLAPYVFDRRANPILFDRVTFLDLQAISGDTGGRAIFSKFSPRYLNWYDRRLLLDVDTPEDYHKLISDDLET